MPSYISSVSVLKDRVDAVEEIMTSSSEQLHKLRTVLRKLPDLAKGLCRIQYGKVSGECVRTYAILTFNYSAHLKSSPFCSWHSTKLLWRSIPLILAQMLDLNLAS